ncbi:TPA: ABC-three component system middle component 6 [Acinetobacter baumannii]|nr:ABC-three component system middle component 6 [Acinetobacter pittii]MCG5225696.1 hypothetical protein [Acinetobacter pittii]
MKIQTALVPHKHVRFAGSLIGIAGYVRQFFDDPISIEGLWARIESDQNSIFKINFTQLIFALDILMFIQEIYLNEHGMICKNVMKK